VRFEPRELVSGLRYTEGPSFDREGSLYFSEIPAGRIHRRWPDGRLALFLDAPAPNGTAFHPNGDLYFCDGGGRFIGIAQPSGAWRVHADSCDGQPFLGPNDLVFDGDGNLYFTDPPASLDDPPIGAVYRVRPTGKVEPIARGLAFPNGIAMASDYSALFVAETATQRIYRLELRPDGTVSERSLFCQLATSAGGPDGMDFGADGNLYVAHYATGNVDAVSPAGRVVDHLPTGGDRVSNVAFRGTTLYATSTRTISDSREDGRVVALEIGVAGQPLYAERAWQQERR
jgi:gluconolactonase